MVDLKIHFFCIPYVVLNLMETFGFLDLHPQWFETDLGNSSNSDLVLLRGAFTNFVVDKARHGRWVVLEMSTICRFSLLTVALNELLCLKNAGFQH